MPFGLISITIEFSFLNTNFAVLAQQIFQRSFLSLQLPQLLLETGVLDLQDLALGYQSRRSFLLLVPAFCCSNFIPLPPLQSPFFTLKCKVRSLVVQSVIKGKRSV